MAQFEVNPIRQSYSTGEQMAICPGGLRGKTDGEAVVSYVNRSGVLQKIYGHDDDGDVFMFECASPLVNTGASNTYGSHPVYHHPAFGYHHVLVSSEKAGAEQWPNMMMAVQDITKWLYGRRRVGYVAVFADVEDASQGPRLQVATLQITPPAIEKEIKAASTDETQRGVCHMCQSVKDSDSPRQLLQTESFVAICPWAPSCPYEFWIVPKRHDVRFLKTSQRDLADLALMLRVTLGGMAKELGNTAYSIAFCLPPEKKSTHQFHWHIGVYPKLEVPASMSRGYGVAVCSGTPEDYAKALGAASRREMAGIMGIY